MNPNALKAYHAKKRAIERKKYSKEAMNYFGKQYWNGLNKNNKAKIYMESTPTKHQRDSIVVVNFANTKWDNLGAYNQRRFLNYLVKKGNISNEIQY